VGYFEGFPRMAGQDQAYVLIAGQRCPVVGRVCMNMMMVDVSALDQVSIGDQVTLIGKDGRESITAEDLASWAKTIHYEITTRLAASVPRVLI